jgi:hypothetical protein
MENSVFWDVMLHCLVVVRNMLLPSSGLESKSSKRPA